MQAAVLSIGNELCSEIKGIVSLETTMSVTTTNEANIIDLTALALCFLRGKLGIIDPTKRQIDEVERLLSVVVIKELLPANLLTKIEDKLH